MNRIMAPFVAPTKVRSLQGKRPAGSGGRALWGPEWTHPPHPQEVLPQRGHGLRPTSRRRLARPTIVRDRPFPSARLIALAARRSSSWCGVISACGVRPAAACGFPAVQDSG
jgi:hypothetical protein